MEDVFWTFLKLAFWSFKKILKKFIDVDNDELYLLEKNQCDIYCIFGYVKMINFHIWDCEQCRIQKSSDLSEFVIFM
jgi:hypothetical protein